MTYKEQLLDPKWQKKRLEIFERDNFACQYCLDKEETLHVHHTEYDKAFKTMAWDYPDYVYKTLCASCHKAITDHINEYGNDECFSTIKIKNGNKKTLFIYTNGMLKFKTPDSEYLTLSERTAFKIVHFLINNWLKNG